jgi:hypothetical protein
MKRARAAAFVILFASTALAGSTPLAAGQDKTPDKIGKDKAPTVLKKALAEVLKKKSAAVSESAELAAGPQRFPPQKFEGVMRKDFAAVKGAAEIYARGDKYLVNLGGRFDPPEELEGQEGFFAQTYKNPALVLDEVARNTAPPQFGPDEMVDGKDCKVVDVVPDAALLRQHLKEFGERLNRAFRRQGGGAFGGAQIFDMKNALDEKNTAASYHICIGKDDLLVYRIDYVMRPKIKPGALPPQVPIPQDMAHKLDVYYSKWDEELPLEIPGVVKNKLGIK